MSKFVHFEYESESICKEYMTLINKFLNNRKECFFNKEDIKDTSKFILITDTDFGNVVINHHGLHEFIKSLDGKDNLFYRIEILNKYNDISYAEFENNKEKYKQEIERDNVSELDVDMYHLCQGLEAVLNLETEYFDIDRMMGADEIDRKNARKAFSEVSDISYERDLNYCKDFVDFIFEISGETND